MKTLPLILSVLVWVFGGVSLGEADTPFASWKLLKNAYGEGKTTKIGTFTAYTASSAQIDKIPRLMASGKAPYIGAVACPKHLEFGTRIRIQGMGEYTCEDRMHRRYRNKNRFDIFMKDRNRALKFGKQQLRYEIVNK